MSIFDPINIVKGAKSFLNPDEGYKKAQQEEEKYYRDAQGNLQPYNQNGQSMFQQLLDQSRNLNNPAQLENQWASGYSMSPYAQQLEKQATSSGMDAASSMGLLGSSAALNNIQQSSGDIMQSDRQKYMDDLMNKYMQSISLGQSIYGTGANAANSMSQNAMTMGNTMGENAYNIQNAPGNMFGKLLGMGVNGAINYSTGGIKPAAVGG